ncbi:NB-ARC domain-containing protein [Streptomyces sp. Go-475]|uniref:NB-ARC domain-containing protein n=1 Tax=Streptomyces sp. Go-475 TaxID=2072505 RepID=UPI0018E56C76|nr:NB-ARC domain-containing protein [Streptomyces sp. Go-475]
MTRADGPYRGSGYRVSRNAVLTAAHVVEGSVSVRVRFEADLPGEWSTPGKTWWGVPGWDIAVVLIDPRPGEPSIVAARCAEVGAQPTVFEAQAVGFPLWKLRSDDGATPVAAVPPVRDSGQTFYRDYHHAVGRVASISNSREGTLELELPSPPMGSWKGMSGAALWRGDRIIGVVTHHHGQEGGRLTAVRLDRVLEDSDPTAKARLRHLLGPLERPALPVTVIEPSPRPAVTGHTVARPELCEPLVERLVSPSGRVPEAGRVSAVLEGPGGFGKTTLAALACDDPRVHARFGTRVYWVTLSEGDQDTDILPKVNDLIAALSGTSTRFGTLGQAKGELGRLLGTERVHGPVLLVIDDVWRPEQLAPFLEGACTRLVTTRTRGLVRDAFTLDVGVLDGSQTLELLTRDLEQGGEARWQPLLRLTGGWPILVGLANRALVRRTRNGLPLADALRFAEENLTVGGPTALDYAKPEHRQQAVFHTVEASLRLLGATDARWPEFFADLAVFPKGVAIPVTTLATYLGITQGETETLCLELADLSLLQRLELAQPASVRLHDVIHHYLAHRTQGRRRELHRQLLDTHAAAHGLLHASAPVRWWELASTEPYLWDWLAYHLSEAADGGADPLLRDLRWIEARVRNSGPGVIGRDFAHATAEDRVLRLLCETLTRSTHLLVPVDQPSVLMATMAGRLHGVEALAEVVELYERHAPGPWLAPAWPLPDQPPRAFRGTRATLDTAVFAVTPDGTRMATGHRDGTVRVWDTAGDRELCRTRLHTGCVMSIDITADGNRVVGTTVAGSGFLWEWQGGVVKSLPGSRRAGDVTTGPRRADDQRSVRIATSAGELGVRFFDEDGRPRRLRPTWGRLLWPQSNPGLAGMVLMGLSPVLVPRPAIPVALLVAFAFTVALIMLRQPWSRRSPNLAEYAEAVYAVALSPDGSLLATAGSLDRTVRLWEPVKGRLRASFSTSPDQGSPDQWGAVAISADNGWVAQAGTRGVFRLWNIRTRRLHVTQKVQVPPTLIPAPSVAFSADGRWVACGSGGELRVWRVADGIQRARLGGLAAVVSDVTFTPDGQDLLSAHLTSHVRVWHLPDLMGSASPRAGSTAETGESGNPFVTDAAFSPDGSWLVMAGADHHVKARAIDGGDLCSFSGHTGAVWAVAVAPDGSWLAGGGDDHTVRLWAPDGSLRGTLTGHAATVCAVAISPDGSLLATGDIDGSLHIWDSRRGALGTASPLTTLGTGPTDADEQQLAFTGDGRLLAANSNGLVIGWHTRDWTPAPTHDLRDPEGTQDGDWGSDALAVSKDGRRLAAFTRHSSSIKVFDLASHDLPPQRHGASLSHVRGLCFSPDNRLLASAHADGTLRVWATGRSDCVTALRVDGFLRRCAWSPTGTHLVAVGTGGIYLFTLRSPHSADQDSPG